MKYEQWNLRAPGDPEARRRVEQAGLPPLCAAVLCARGLDTADRALAFLSHDTGLLHDPFLLRDMDRAAARITAALAQGETIAVYGDYDVDGITATALLTHFLQSRQGHVISYIPDRMEEGYGLNAAALARLRERGVSLIVTVDCGITAVQEVAVARSLGLDVVVTDHHHCKEVLPDAVAVVDPRRADCTYPFPDLAGVGVALKLALALTPVSRREEVLARYLELAAIGTVADVMLLTGENRAIVHHGLLCLARTTRPGLKALLEEVAPGQTHLTAVNISYGLAPRINAAGRMEQAMVALELLLTDHEAQGRALAQELCRLNRERQAIEQDIFDQCTARLQRQPQLPAALVLAGEGWHQGVVGIVASRLAERHARPVFMICLDQGHGKGSCRSFGHFHLFQALEACAPLLDGYGGHELAAGFTILEENIPAFSHKIEELVSHYTEGRPMVSSIPVDADIDDCGWLTCEQVEALEQMEPFGAGNARPVLCLRGALVVSCSDVGGSRHLKVRLRRDSLLFDGIFFGATTADAGISPGNRVDILFTPQINQFRGRRTVQLQLCDLRLAPTRAQAERALFDRLCQGETLTPREAELLLPRREDFAHLWRLLERSCPPGTPSAPLERLVRTATRTASHHSYGRTMVCIQVMDERGLIRVQHNQPCSQVSLTRPAEKVDLEQSKLLRRLRALAQR